MNRKAFGASFLLTLQWFCCQYPLINYLATTTEEPPTTTEEPATTTIKPTPPPKPSQSGFDAWSFVGGILITIGLSAIIYFSIKYYRSRMNHEAYERIDSQVV